MRNLIGDAVMKFCGDGDSQGADQLFDSALQQDSKAARKIMNDIADAMGAHYPNDPLVENLRRHTGNDGS